MSKPEVFTQLVVFPGVPIETINNAVGLLLNVHSVEHQLPANPNNFDTGALTTGNEFADFRATNQYMELNGFLKDLSRDHNKVVCDSKSDGISLHLTFTCS